jgi:hypothetical protein
MALLAIVMAPVALAHVPELPDEGSTLGTATVVSDPAKSQALYGELHGAAEPWYFRMELRAGDRLWLSLLTPEEGGFTPSLVVMGPGLAPSGEAPSYVEVPANASVLVINGSREKVDYEPFTPGAYHFTAELDRKVDADGTYYVAVLEPSRGGAFSLAVGYKERFSVTEWVGLPFQLMRINRWEGEGWAFILGPAVATVVAGLALIVLRGMRLGHQYGAFQWLCVVSGLLSVGTGAGVLSQMLDAAALSGLVASMGITLMFVLLPAVFGAVMVRVGLATKGPPALSDRLGLLLLGALSMGLLAGYIVGPVLAFVAAALPPRLAMWGLTPTE